MMFLLINFLLGNDVISGKFLSMANQIYSQNANMHHLSIRSRDVNVLLTYQQIQLMLSYFGKRFIEG